MDVACDGRAADAVGYSVHRSGRPCKHRRRSEVDVIGVRPSRLAAVRTLHVVEGEVLPDPGLCLRDSLIGMKVPQSFQPAASVKLSTSPASSVSVATSVSGRLANQRTARAKLSSRPCEIHLTDIGIAGGRPEAAASICKHLNQKAKKSGLMRPRAIARSSQRRL